MFASAEFRTQICVGIVILFASAWRIEGAASSNPCDSNPCGRGAECQLRSNLAVCSCPGDTSGDPFVSCQSSSSTSRDGPSTTTVYTSSSTAPHYTVSSSSGPTDSSTSSTYSSRPSETTHQSQTSTRFSDFDRYGTGTRTSSSPSSTTTYYTHSSHPSTASSPVIETYSVGSRYTNSNDDSPPHRTIITTHGGGSQDRFNSDSHFRDTIRDSYRETSSSPSYSSQPSSTFVYQGGNDDYNHRRYEDNYSQRYDYHPDMGHRRYDHAPDSIMNRRNDYHFSSATNTRDDIPDLNFHRRPDNYYHDNAQTHNNYYNRNPAPYRNHFREEYPVVGERDQFSNRNSYHESGDNRRRNEYEEYRPVYADTAIRGDYANNYGSRDRVHGSSPSFEKNSPIRDPLGVYKNCIEINKVIVCADETAFGDSPSNPGHSKPEPISGHAAIPTNTYRPNNDPIRNNHEMSTSNRNNYNDNSNGNDFHRRQGAPSNIYQELVVGTQDKPASRFPPSSAQEDMPKVTPGPGDSVLCKKYCGENAVCRSLNGRAICGCPEGYTGDASVRCYPEEEQMRMKNRCQKHLDCADNEICENSQCLDPCANSNSVSNNDGPQHRRQKRMNHFDDFSSRRPTTRNSNSNDNHSLRRVSASQISASGNTGTTVSSTSRNGMCGSNTKCQVIGHTPLCRCKDGYTGNPYTGCVPSKK